MGRLTRDDVSGIHRILVLDEAEAVHQLHLCNFSGAMSRKVSLDIGLGSCRERACQWNPKARNEGNSWVLWTIAREVAQIEPGGRNLGHGGDTSRVA